MTIQKTPQYIQNLFDTIASKYDFMNNIISLGFQKNIKSKAVKLLDIPPEAKILDACCGTGDIVSLIKLKFPNSEITGIDFSSQMIEIAKNKNPNINFVLGDITKTQFPSDNFNTITMAFGFRNIPDKEKTLNELHRILKTNGEFLHLDFGEKNIFNSIFDKFTPILAEIFCGNSAPYKYLINSKKEFPSPNELIKLFEAFGFKLKKRRDFVFGAISAQVFVKI